MNIMFETTMSVPRFEWSDDLSPWVVTKSRINRSEMYVEWQTPFLLKFEWTHLDRMIRGFGIAISFRNLQIELNLHLLNYDNRYFEIKSSTMIVISQT